MPVLTLYDAPAPRYDSYVTAGVPAWRRVLRQQRAAEVDEVPQEVASALPGAINAELLDRWDGRFRPGKYPAGTRERLANTLRKGRNVNAVLADIGKRSQGNAALLVWVDQLQSEPLTTLGFPGDLVNTVSGPMYVDLVQEHHRVQAHVGVAVVTGDGQVVMRLSREVESVVSLRVDAAQAAQRMAQEIARDMALVWPDAGRPSPASGSSWGPAELAQR